MYNYNEIRHNIIGDFMRIEHIMSRDLIVMDINSNIYDIAIQMKEFDIGFIPINKGNKIVGVLTDRDIVVKLLANKSEKIEGYINKDIVKININNSIESAISLMGDKKVKRLLVEDNNKLVGILSLSDILNNCNSDIVYENIKKIYEIYRNTDEHLIDVHEFEL